MCGQQCAYLERSISSSGAAECRLTPRSRGDPTRHGALAPRRAVAGSIVLRGARAPCRMGRLSSNVSPHVEALCAFVLWRQHSLFAEPSALRRRLPSQRNGSLRRPASGWNQHRPELRPLGCSACPPSFVSLRHLRCGLAVACLSRGRRIQALGPGCSLRGAILRVTHRGASQRGGSRRRRHSAPLRPSAPNAG